MTKISYLTKIGILFCIYFFAAKFGLGMNAISKFASLVWPPTGIAIASLILFGRNLWPGVFLGAFFLNHMTGAPVLVSLGIGAGNTLEALFASYLLENLTDFHKPLDRIRDVISFSIIACVLSPIISATIGVTSLWLGKANPLEGFAITWQAWWLGDALGALIIAPLILSWSSFKIKNTFDPWIALEAAGFMGFVVVSAYVIFNLVGGHVFWLFPFVVWGALRFGQIGSTSLTFVICALAIWTATRGIGLFSVGTIRSNLFFLDTFMSVISTTGMILAASLTERKQAIKDLNYAVQSRDEFLSIASHELKTPLTSLSLQIQMTKLKIKPSENILPSAEALAKVFDVSEKQVNRLTELIEDLLDTSRIQTGKFNFNFERANLSLVVKDMVYRFLDQLKKEKCIPEINIEENIMAFFDPTRIEQVIENLITNVLKYAPGRLVKISLTQSHGYVKLVVEDRGPGVIKERQSKIFERFERASDSKSVTGLGLGLFIVNEIAKGHSGKVYLEPTIEPGSKFVFEFPLNFNGF